VEAQKELRRLMGLGEPLECNICRKALPDKGVVMSILLETPLATGSRHFCSMEHLIEYVVRLKDGGSPLYEFLHERGREGVSLKGVIERIQELERMVMEAVERRAELEEKVKALKEEKARLLAEIEAFKAIPELEAKVSALETEVAKLREEKKALEEEGAPPPAEAPPPVEERPLG